MIDMTKEIFRICCGAEFARNWIKINKINKSCICVMCLSVNGRKLRPKDARLLVSNLKFDRSRADGIRL